MKMTKDKLNFGIQFTAIFILSFLKIKSFDKLSKTEEKIDYDLYVLYGTLCDILKKQNGLSIA